MTTTPTHAAPIDAPAAAPALPALLELMRSRRSIRRTSGRPIERALLESLLEAATWAPSAHNRQPWRFAVVQEPEAKGRLADAMAAAWRRDLAADGAPADVVERRAAISRARILGAAALVVAALSMAEMDAYPDASRAEAEWTMAVQSTALACQNLLLAAHAARLGACWMCAPLFVPAVVCEALALPADWQPQALITLGWPAEAPQKTRAPLASRVLWR